MAEQASSPIANSDSPNSIERPDPPSPRIGLPVAGLVLLILTHAWPWALPMIERDAELWTAPALGQLTFWPLYIGLVGFRRRRPFTALCIGGALGVAGVWLSFWQLTWMSAESTEPLSYSIVGLASLPILVLLSVVIERSLGRDRGQTTRTTLKRTIRRTALAALAIYTVLVTAAIVPWIIISTRDHAVENWQRIALGTIAGAIAAMTIAGLWAALAVMTLERHPREWRRTLIGFGIACPVLLAVAWWFAAPYVRHVNAALALIDSGVEVTAWNIWYDHQRPYTLERVIVQYSRPVSFLKIDGARVSGDNAPLLRQLNFDTEELGVEIIHPDETKQWLAVLADAPVTAIRIGSPDEASPERVTISDSTIALIATFPALKAVELYNADISVAGFRSLARIPHLVFIHAFNTPLGDDGLAAIAECAALESLTLERAGVTDAGLAHLASARKLLYLDLDSNTIRGPGLVHVGKLPNLKFFSLNSNPVDDESLCPLGDLTNLTKLSLRHTNVTGSGLRHLTRLSNLNSMELDGTQIDDASAMSLAALPLQATIDFGGYSDVSIQGVLNLHRERLRLATISPIISAASARELAVWIELAESTNAESESRTVGQHFAYDVAVLTDYGIPSFDISEYRRAVFQEPNDTCCAAAPDGESEEPTSAHSTE